MTTTDSNGIVHLQPSDIIAPFETLINTLQSATSAAVAKATRGPLYAANVTARNALLTQYGSSASNPLWVNTAGVLAVHNGTSWTTYIPAGGAAAVDTPFARVYRSSVLGVPGATWTTVTAWTAEPFGRFGGVTFTAGGGFSVLTKGIYAVSAQCSWAVSTAGLYRGIRLRAGTTVVAGSETFAAPRASVATQVSAPLTYVLLNPGDTITTQLFQDVTPAGSNHNATDIYMSLEWVRPA